MTSTEDVGAPVSSRTRPSNKRKLQEEKKDDDSLSLSLVQPKSKRVKLIRKVKVKMTLEEKIDLSLTRGEFDEKGFWRANPNYEPFDPEDFTMKDEKEALVLNNRLLSITDLMNLMQGWLPIIDQFGVKRPCRLFDTRDGYWTYDRMTRKPIKPKDPMITKHTTLLIDDSFVQKIGRFPKISFFRFLSIFQRWFDRVLFIFFDFENLYSNIPFSLNEDFLRGFEMLKFVTFPSILQIRRFRYLGIIETCTDLDNQLGSIVCDLMQRRFKSEDWSWDYCRDGNDKVIYIYFACQSYKDDKDKICYISFASQS